MSNRKLTIGSLVVHQPLSSGQNPNALRRSLEANLVRNLAQIRLGGSRESKVVQARISAIHASSNIGSAVSKAIAQALGKSG